MSDFDLVPHQEGAIAISTKAEFKEYTKFSNRQPDKKHIKKNSLANNSEYLPIAYIEKELDEAFKGLWSYEVESAEVKLNSVVVTLSLRVFHPAGVWLTRGGIGAVPVQLKQGEKEINPMTINAMALQKNFPSAKSIALKNAAQSLGNAFGRSLNREDADNYDINLYDEQIAEYNPLLEEANQLLSESSLEGAERTNVAKSIDKANNEKLKSIIIYLKKHKKNA